jgi:hypothetical protein
VIEPPDLFDGPGRSPGRRLRAQLDMPFFYTVGNHDMGFGVRRLARAARTRLLGVRLPGRAVPVAQHRRPHTTRRGRDYVAMGTTGGVWLSRGPGAFDQVAWVTVTDDGPVFALIRLDGLLDVRAFEARSPLH